MIERLLEYRNKCEVLKQIQSNKALRYRRINLFQNILTVLVSGFITFIGFSGADTVYKYIHKLFANASIDIETIRMFYNLFVFILFIVVIFHLVFHFSEKQSSAERAVSLLSSLINEIDDLIEKEESAFLISSISNKYELIIQIIPSNTDREYVKAKRSICKKKKSKKGIVDKISLFALSRAEQESFLIKIIKSSNTTEKILEVLREQNSELYLGGGVVRNLVWDHMHNYSQITKIDDIDVIYFDKQDITEEHDNDIENTLKTKIKEYKWSVKNQARMASINGDAPYESLAEAVTKWPETASALLVKKEKDDSYTIIAPFGFDDLFSLVVRPTPRFISKIDKYQQRVNEHKWKEKWNRLRILYMEESLIENAQNKGC